MYMKKHDTHVHEPYGELYIAEDGLIAKVSESQIYLCNKFKWAAHSKSSITLLFEKENCISTDDRNL